MRLTAVVAKGGDRDIGPKRRAVLAHAPSGIDKAALFRGYLQLVLRPAALFRFGRIKDRKVLPDDLARRVALDPLSPAVPGGHPAIGIEHEDGVFADAFDQEAKALFAPAQVLFVGASLRQIARDLGEPYKLPSAISQAVMTTFAQNSVPSFLTRQPSSSNAPASARDLEFVLRQSALLALPGDRSAKSAAR